MRPVGGLTIGYIGDRYGRKQALVLSLFLMAFPTFLMGCLPTYEQVGALSTISLVVCRLLQGMSVGGQLPASLVYTVEIRPKAHWGYYGALVMSKPLYPSSDLNPLSMPKSQNLVDERFVLQWLRIVERY